LARALGLILILALTLPLPLGLSGLNESLLAGVGNGVLVLRQTIQNSAATGLHPGTHVLCVGLARRAHLV
jgi:hypothetical protein